MNDRFKFRVWDKINEIWVKNFSIDEQGCVEGFYNPPQAMNRRLVLMQCTGLKDKNGKLIYEGDIVKDDHEALHQVVWCYNGYELRPLFKNGYTIGIVDDEIVVIGNRYENIGLLKECE